MPTSTLIHQRPTQPHPTHSPAAKAVVLCEVTCECGYRDHDTPGDDPTAFLARSLKHLETHHPDIFDHPIG